jgi:hypothetical protein
MTFCFLHLRLFLSNELVRSRFPAKIVSCYMSPYLILFSIRLLRGKERIHNCYELDNCPVVKIHLFSIVYLFQLMHLFNITSIQCQILKHLKTLPVRGRVVTRPLTGTEHSQQTSPLRTTHKTNERMLPHSHVCHI